MDYEKKYKEALERVENIKTGKCETTFIFTEGLFEYIFPELTESEGEGIRKALLDMVHNTTGGSLWVDYNLDKEDAIAWLEKQGEKKHQKEIDDAYLRGISDAKHELEKQGEQKPVFEMKTPEESLGIDSETYSKIVDECICGEQKPDDKVEPKFKAGDWTVENEPNNYARFIQILEIGDVQGKERYRISRDLHNDEDVAECRFIEKNYHSFTIQDAKDGDVLADRRVILLFKGIGNSEYANVIDYYASIETNFGNLFSIPKEGEYWGYASNCNLKPATKEQRNLLFQKMKEVGYEWDAEKKELKKIEQKLWSDEDEKTIKEIKQFIRSRGMRLAQSKVDSWIAYLEKQREHKPAEWSHIDENRINNICDFIQGHTNFADSAKEAAVVFLKSLKDKVQPQSQWKPSDEQMIALKCAITTADEKWVCMNTKDLESLYEDLQKLKK